MKKYIAIAIGLMFIATPIYAEEAPATLTLQQQYQETLVQLIGLLQQQVNSLLAQLQALQTSQAKLETKIDNNTQVLGSIQTNTTPLPVVTLVTPIVPPSPTPEPILPPVIISTSTSASIENLNNAIVSLPLNQAFGYPVGNFIISELNEPVTIGRIDYTTDNNTSFGNTKIYISFDTVGGSIGQPNVDSTVINQSKPIRVLIMSANLPYYLGQHSVTINSIDLIGQSSHQHRNLTGLPITFTYELK